MDRGHDAAGTTEALEPVTIDHGRVLYQGEDLGVVDFEMHVNSAGFVSAVLRIHDRGGLATFQGPLDHCIRSILTLRSRSA